MHLTTFLYILFGEGILFSGTFVSVGTNFSYCIRAHGCCCLCFT